MPKSKRIKLTDIRIAIAKECIIYEDSSKETITRITRAYLAQLRKEGIHFWEYAHKKSPSETSNATKVQFEIEKLKKHNNG
tara:strand:- start:3081 stop:3323 length:243 start_codon:yes stop_codon:yes gene_type:complete